MNITLDELLNKNTTDYQGARVTFPSYESFKASHSVYGQTQYAADTRRDASYDMQRDAYQDVRYAEPVNNYVSAPDYTQGNQYSAAPRYEDVRPNENLYAYTARMDNARALEFDNRLASTYQAPAYNNNNVSVNAPVFNESETRTKKRARLNTKGKVILGLYLAVVAVAISLIIAYAGKINRGEALQPASNEGASAVQTVGNNSESYAINSEYEVLI